MLLFKEVWNWSLATGFKVAICPISNGQILLQANKDKEVYDAYGEPDEAFKILKLRVETKTQINRVN